MTASSDTTLDVALARVLDSYAELGELAEEIDEEWTYIQDLAGSWRERLEEVVAARGPQPIQPDVAAALAAAVDEIGRIEDPHRALDWLSTFPQLVLVALGERP